MAENTKKVEKKEEPADRKKYRRIVLWGLLTFFGVIFVANGILIYQAETSWTGLETEDAYEKGLKYNEQIAEKKAMNELGWEGEITFDKSSETTGMLKLSLVDKEGQPVRKSIVIAEFVRPTAEGFDDRIPLGEKRAGIYMGPVSLKAPGQWDINITAMKNAEEKVKFHKRIDTSK